MGPTAAELREEVEARRSEIERDLEALADRVDPAGLVEREKEAVKSRLHDMRETVTETAGDALRTTARSTGDGGALSSFAREQTALVGLAAAFGLGALLFGDGKRRWFAAGGMAAAIGALMVRQHRHASSHEQPVARPVAVRSAVQDTPPGEPVAGRGRADIHSDESAQVVPAATPGP